ncbi:MAG: hypothetical protein C5B51_31185 [Terriglobia bacterium]|nr:MAG: hypothetical protein C5B51_31185 [Terriglobia bacterium]
MYPGVVSRREMSWYSARTLVRLVATGKPKAVDQYFDSASTLLEDRVVLIRAANIDAAIKQAEEEAHEYCRRTRYKNIYGQSVRMKLLGKPDVIPFDHHELVSGSEVYSSTAIVPQAISDEALRRNRFGQPDTPGAPSRYKFIEGKLLTRALDATGLAARRHVRSRRRPR